MICLLNESLESRMREHEQEPTRPREARATIEESLSYQFQELAKGLLAYLALRGRANKKIWWQQHLMNPATSPGSSDVTAFAQQFVTDLAARRIRPISPRDIGKIEVRIFGGFTGLWDDQRINRQLSRLGSGCRLAFIGSNRLLVNQVREFLGRTSMLPVDARFIFGHVSWMSVWSLGPIFNFETELATSPFIDLNGLGLAYENRIIVRQSILRRLLGDDGAAKFRALSTVAHEMYHVTGFHSPHSYSHLEALWEEETVADICRFTETPRTLAEIGTELFLNFDNFILKDINQKLGSEHFVSPPHSLESLIQVMEKDNLIIREVDGRIRCHIFDEGNRWSP